RVGSGARVAVWVNWGVVDPHVGVQMWAGRAAAQPNVTKQITAIYRLPLGNSKAGKVSETRTEIRAVLHDDQPAVTGHGVGVNHHAIGGRADRLAVRAGNVNAAVERAFTIKWINALAERPGHRTFHRPQAG